MWKVYAKDYKLKWLFENKKTSQDKCKRSKLDVKSTNRVSC